MKFILAIILGVFFSLSFSSHAIATVSNANILSLGTSATNVTTSAYAQLSSSSPISSARLVIVNQTTSSIRLGIGSTGNEVGLLAVGPSSTTHITLGAAIPSGSRLGLEAIDATASAGFISVSLLP